MGIVIILSLALSVGEGHARVITLLDEGVPDIPPYCSYAWVEDDVNIVTQPTTWCGGSHCGCSGPCDISGGGSAVSLAPGKLAMAWDLQDCLVVGAEVLLSEWCGVGCTKVEFQGGYWMLNEQSGQGETMTYGAWPGSSFEYLEIDSCDGLVEEVTLFCSEGCDEDGDGWYSTDCEGLDCDDDDPAAYPGAPDDCDGWDQNCDGTDGFPETCDNGIDDDCDQYIDALDTDCCDDRDEDMFTDEACGGLDCEDADPDIHPLAVERQSEGICDDGIDNNCDGLIDGDDPSCASACSVLADPNPRCSIPFFLVPLLALALFAYRFLSA